jgi:hypothetical protein
VTRADDSVLLGDAAEQTFRRPPAEQRIEYDDGLDRDAFTGCQFIGILDTGSIKFQRSGAVELTFVVPAGHVMDALELRHLYKMNLPLSIDVQVIRRAQQDANDADDKIRQLHG